MTITVLAVLFLLLIILIAFFGQRILVKKTASLEEAHQFVCSICRNTFEKSDLVERQIGDFKMMYFCTACIRGLYEDMTRAAETKSVVPRR